MTAATGTMAVQDFGTWRAITTDRRHAKVFIGAPMSGLEPDAYVALRAQVLDMRAQVSRAPGVSDVYFAGEAIASAQDFSDPAAAALRDFTALAECDVFVFFYPERSASSVLIELGYALAMRKRVILMVRREDDIPFLLRHADGPGMRALLPPLERIVLAPGQDPAAALVSIL